MKDSRIIDILKSFNEEELKSFKKFLDSPFVNSRRKISILFNYIVKHCPAYDSVKLEKEYVFGKIFPDEQYNEKKISNYISDLTKAVEDFLMHNAIITDEIDSLMYTSRGFYNKKLYSHALKIISRVEKKIDPGFSSKKNYFGNMRKIEYLKGVYYSDTDFEKLNKSENSSFEIAALQFLVDYTWMRCESETASGTFFTKEKNSLNEMIAQCFDVKRLLEHIDKFDSKLTPIALLHYRILKTIEDPENSENYKTLKDMFYKDISAYDREERYMVFGHLLNCCGEKIRNYNQDFASEMFDVYKNMLEHNSYSKSESEYILIVDFRNILMLAILFGDTLFLEKLINVHSDYINPELKSDVVLLSRANLYFLRGEFNVALEMISKVKNENFVFKLDLRILKLKTFYELGYIEEAYSLIDSHKHYITNTKGLSKLTKSSNINFLKAYTELLKIKSGVNTKNIYLLDIEIQNLGKYQFKDWFINKSKELKKNQNRVTSYA